MVQNIEEHVPGTMDVILDTENKIWHKKRGIITNLLCIFDLNIEESKSYDICQVGKQTKMPYKKIQHLFGVYEWPVMDFMRLEQGVIIEGRVDG